MYWELGSERDRVRVEKQSEEAKLGGRRDVGCGWKKVREEESEEVGKEWREKS